MDKATQKAFEEGTCESNEIDVWHDTARIKKGEDLWSWLKVHCG